MVAVGVFKQVSEVGAALLSRRTDPARILKPLGFGLRLLYGSVVGQEQLHHARVGLVVAIGHVHAAVDVAAIAEDWGRLCTSLLVLPLFHTCLDRLSYLSSGSHGRTDLLGFFFYPAVSRFACCVHTWNCDIND